MTCVHKDFNAFVEVRPIAQNEGDQKPAYYAVEVRISCRVCGKPLEWAGLPVGLSPYRPAVSLDGLELRAPMTLQGEKVPAGMPGFMVSHVESPQKEPVKQ